MGRNATFYSKRISAEAECGAVVITVERGEPRRTPITVAISGLNDIQAEGAIGALIRAALQMMRNAPCDCPRCAARAERLTTAAAIFDHMRVHAGCQH